MRLRQSLALLASPALDSEDALAEEAFVQRQLGRILRLGGSREQVEQGRGHLEASLRVCRKLEDDLGVADVLYELSYYAVGDSEPERAREPLNQSLALQRQVGEPQRLARSLIALRLVSRTLAAYDEARRAVEQAYATFRTTGQLYGMVDARYDATILAWILGEFDQCAFLNSAGYPEPRVFA